MLAEGSGPSICIRQELRENVTAITSARTGPAPAVGSRPHAALTQFTTGALRLSSA